MCQRIQTATCCGTWRHTHGEFWIDNGQISNQVFIANRELQPQLATGNDAGKRGLGTGALLIEVCRVDIAMKR